MVELMPAAGDHVGPVLLVLAWLFAFAESAIGLGVLLPGETAVLALGGTAANGTRLTVLVAVVASGACAGDHVGYLLGRRHGHRLHQSRLVQRLGTLHWDRAVGALRRHGATAVFLSRLLPVLRTLTPAAAGASGVSYAGVLAASAAGATVWAAVWVGAGAAGAASMPVVTEHPAVTLAAVCAVAVALGITAARRRVGALPR